MYLVHVSSSTLPQPSNALEGSCHPPSPDELQAGNAWDGTSCFGAVLLALRLSTEVRKTKQVGGRWDGGQLQAGSGLVRGFCFGVGLRSLSVTPAALQDRCSPEAQIQPYSAAPG